jgi:hypothetical protein
VVILFRRFCHRVPREGLTGEGRAVVSTADYGQSGREPEDGQGRLGPRKRRESGARGLTLGRACSRGWSESGHCGPEEREMGLKKCFSFSKMEY